MKKILLIDDEESDAQSLQTRLHQAGLEAPFVWLQEASDGIAYLAGDFQYADRSQYPIPAILLLDLGLPGGGGLNTLQWVKSQPPLNRILTVMITNHGEGKDLREAYRLGAHSYLNRSGTEEEFHNFVEFARSFKVIAKPLPDEVVEPSAGW